jgi:beta-lactam-binding protein with PASTA domain
MTYDDAEAKLRGLGFTSFRRSTSANPPPGLAGKVVNTIPGTGTVALTNATITIVVGANSQPSPSSSSLTPTPTNTP